MDASGAILVPIRQQVKRAGNRTTANRFNNNQAEGSKQSVYIDAHVDRNLSMHSCWKEYSEQLRKNLLEHPEIKYDYRVARGWVPVTTEFFPPELLTGMKPSGRGQKMSILWKMCKTNSRLAHLALPQQKFCNVDIAEGTTWLWRELCYKCLHYVGETQCQTRPCTPVCIIPSCRRCKQDARDAKTSNADSSRKRQRVEPPPFVITTQLPLRGFNLTKSHKP
jgi:hypothetical protein